MNVYVLDIAPLRGREREALALLPEERREKALRIRREEARLRSIGASLLLSAAGFEPPFACGEHGKPYIPGGPHFFTHAQRHARRACRERHPVGLDIEKISCCAAPPLTIEERKYMETDPERRFALSLDTQGGRAKMHRRGTLAADERLSVLGNTASPEGAATLALHRGIRKLYAVGGCGAARRPLRRSASMLWSFARRIRYGTEETGNQARCRAALAG